ncbi:metallophosphoesterase [Rhodobacteraceae bacterium M382]|nr:metallophosphoesterase [Rhodobacteraceae bacterium M382]
MAKLIWMTDLHFARRGLVVGHDPRVRVQQAVKFVCDHLADGDLCLISGDMVELAQPDEYQALRTLLAELPMPVCPMVGNHDDRSMLRAAFALPGQVMDAFVQYAVEVGDVVLICLDTLIPGEAAGFLCDARLAWLEAQLHRAAGRPVVVAMHHPPLALGLDMLDPDNLTNGTQLLDLLEKFPNVVQFLAGHVHRPISGVVRGIGFRTQRAVLYQAPAPVPRWDWGSFTPPAEAPGLGVVSVETGQVTVQDLQFCPYEIGGAAIQP